MVNKTTLAEITELLSDLEFSDRPFGEKLGEIEDIGGVATISKRNGGKIVFKVIENGEEVSYYLPIKYEVIEEGEESIENSRDTYDFVFSAEDLSTTKI